MATKLVRKENLTTLGGRLKAAMREVGMSQRKLAEHFDISEQAVSQWVRNITHPDNNKLFAISKMLGISAEWLKFGERNRQLFPEEMFLRGWPVPVISRVQFGKYSRLKYELGKRSYYILVESGAETSPDTFAIQINDESMLPEFKPGDIVIIDPAVPPSPGDFVLASFEGPSVTTFRKFRPIPGKAENEEFELLPLNAEWSAIVVVPEMLGQIFGTMIEHRSYRRGRGPVLHKDLILPVTLPGDTEPTFQQTLSSIIGNFRKNYRWLEDYPGPPDDFGAKKLK